MTSIIDKGVDSHLRDRERLSLALPRAVYTHQFQRGLTSQLNNTVNPQDVISAAIASRARDIHEQRKCVTEETRRAQQRLRRAPASFIAGRSRHLGSLHDAILHHREDNDGTDSDGPSEDITGFNDNDDSDVDDGDSPSHAASKNYTSPHPTYGTDTNRSPFLSIKSSSSQVNVPNTTAATANSDDEVSELSSLPAAGGSSTPRSSLLLPSLSLGRNTLSSSSPYQNRASGGGSSSTWYMEGLPRGSPVLTRRGHMSCSGAAPTPAPAGGASGSGISSVDSLPPMQPGRLVRTHMSQSTSGIALMGTMGRDRDRERESQTSAIASTDGAAMGTHAGSGGGGCISRTVSRQLLSPLASPSRASSGEIREHSTHRVTILDTHVSANLGSSSNDSNNNNISTGSSSMLNSHGGTHHHHHLPQQQQRRLHKCSSNASSNSSGSNNSGSSMVGLTPRVRSFSSNGFLLNAALRATKAGLEPDHSARAPFLKHGMSPLQHGASASSLGVGVGSLNGLSSGEGSGSLS
ncbi:hypothetical protein Agub_g15315 [Astrephomene gubernaculifera]|uniref:Uncharacterized protein n=1 Tax=Astrephomene gubernaculifera TaxID=47775 RepID=A0AAD3E5A4_9CHLO|nr:hypothetical protein Agub_g15315 [Astrephomene gubernaculifera]